MATITITVPDAVVPRILTAFGHWDPVNIGTWIPADQVAMKAALKDFAKQQVLSYESGQARIAAAASVSAEVW